jgi:hypothetical protein
MSEFAPALDMFEKRARDEAGSPGVAEIVPFDRR